MRNDVDFDDRKFERDEYGNIFPIETEQENENEEQDNETI